MEKNVRQWLVVFHFFPVCTLILNDIYSFILALTPQYYQLNCISFTLSIKLKIYINWSHVTGFEPTGFT
jgi:hypothetical protein